MLASHTFRPGGIDFSQGGIQVGQAADVVGHAGPEGTGADLARHQVRTVEAEAGRPAASSAMPRSRSSPYISSGVVWWAASAPPLSSQTAADCGHSEVFHQGIALRAGR